MKDPTEGYTTPRRRMVGLVAPTGLAVDPQGAVYITNRTATTGHGEVLRVTGLT